MSTLDLEKCRRLLGYDDYTADDDEYHYQQQLRAALVLLAEAQQTLRELADAIYNYEAVGCLADAASGLAVRIPSSIAEVCK